MALLVVTVITGRTLLPVDPLPQPERRSIGLVPPVGAPAGEGFAIGMAVRVTDCASPVEVTLVTNASAGYWRHRGAGLDEWSRVSVTVPHAEVDTMRAGLATPSRDLVEPMNATAPPSPYIRNVSRSRAQWGAPVISAEVQFWERHLKNVLVQFNADWLQERGLGSCYLRIPGVTGSGSILAAQQVLGRAARDYDGASDSVHSVIGSPATGFARYAPELAVGWGATTVIVRKGAIDAGASVPAPNQTREGFPAWTCRTTRTSGADRDQPQVGGDIVLARNGGGGAFSPRYLTREQEGDCSAVVAITMANAGLSRDAWLLILGALLGLGATLIVEPLVATLARRRAAAP